MISLEIGSFCRVPIKMAGGILTVNCVLTHIDVEQRQDWESIYAHYVPRREVELVLRFKAVGPDVIERDVSVVPEQGNLETKQQARLTDDTEHTRSISVDG